MKFQYCLSSEVGPRAEGTRKKMREAQDWMRGNLEQENKRSSIVDLPTYISAVGHS